MLHTIPAKGERLQSWNHSLMQQRYEQLIRLFPYTYIYGVKSKVSGHYWLYCPYLL